MKSIFQFLLLVFCFALPMKATVWQIGVSRQYTMPSQVSSLVKNNDTVEIDAGTYSEDVAHWTANNLLLQGVGGTAHMKSNGKSFGGKAIWVIGGNNTNVAFIEFSECKVPDGNGAGIRLEAANLTVHGCYFHDNEDGILAGDNPSSDILIEYCEFSRNGKGDGYSHNLYINHVHSLTFQYNYSHHTMVGHELKSRAYNNYILYNRLSNEVDGTASRNIDLPNGGTAIIMGNEIQQGTLTENSNMIGYGLEGLSNPSPHELYIVNNTIVNERSAGSFLSVKEGAQMIYARNNIFAGVGTVIVGMASIIDTSHNWTGSIADANFADSKLYDYHLLKSSPAVNSGEDIAKTVNGIFLVPTNEYRHPRNLKFRIKVGAIDIGAHENTEITGVDESKVLTRSFVYLNSTSDNYTIVIPDELKESPKIEVSDLNGNLVLSYLNTPDNKGNITIGSSQFLASGMYFIRIFTYKDQLLMKVIIDK
ncbi:MAG: T9SS type A sorting domain-containing protein [Ignavibacteriae bacterium]|nr:T9SS type A sorting domain-containing protein [Ignavibacteriota bacterium]